MFQNLRQNNQIYILHKTGTVTMETGLVVSVSLPMPKYQVPPVFGQPTEMVVDIVAKVNGQETTFQRIPANMDIADFGGNGIVISDSREAMNAEVLSLKGKCMDVIKSVDYNREVVASCDRILELLNPEYAERQAQQNEMNELKAQMSTMMDMLTRLTSGTQSATKKKE